MAGQDTGARGELIRRSIMLQLKLIVDGVRDFLLVPVALVATLAGLLRGGDDPSREFNRVIELGRATDEWIDLFGVHQAAREAADVPDGAQGASPRNLEEWANRAEAAIQKEINSGELSEQAARALRRAMGRPDTGAGQTDGRAGDSEHDPGPGQ